SYCAKDLAPSSRVARQQRLRQTLRCLPVGRDISVLEVGCGAGFTASYLEGMYREYVGVDYAEELIAYARTHHDRPGARSELTAAQLRESLTRAGFEDVRLIPQGVFSTPFAEVPLKPAALWGPVASVACLADRAIEAAARPLLRPLSWNLVAAGRKPEATT